MTDLMERTTSQSSAAGGNSAPPAAALSVQGVLAALDRANIAYCASHGYEDESSSGSDIDCIVAPSDMRRLTEALYDALPSLGAQIVRWLADDAHYVVFAAKSKTSPPRLLQFHANPDCRCGDRVFFTAEDFLASRRRHASGFYIPTPDLEFAAYLVRRVAKGSLAPEHGQRLSHLYKQDPRGCRARINHFWPQSDALFVAAAAEAGDWGGVRGYLPHLRNQLLRSAGRRDSLAIRVGRRLKNQAFRLRRWLKPDGVHVVFLGPDGVGKSTIIDRVLPDLAGAFPWTVFRTFAPTIARRNSNAREDPDAPKPHAKKPRSLPASLVKAAWWLVYYTLGYFVETYREMAGGALVVNHRYLCDAVVDPRRYRYSGPMWLLSLIHWIAPKPDLILVLDAPADVIQSRKQEVPVEETRRALRAYRTLVVSTPNAWLLNADQTIDKVVADADRLILDFLAARTARRRGVKR